uniref:Uncharacterized protein n=1 Tax=Myotis myotis TaxID=51298 RepID=A0A7J7RRP8_MYOMY|nr:hypothetical protein mMyoMyo1_010206 [Myotis myotis]
MAAGTIQAGPSHAGLPSTPSAPVGPLPSDSGHPWATSLCVCVCFKYIFLLISERKGEGERDRNINDEEGLMDRLPPARPTLGIEPSTRACALAGHRTVTSWFLGGHPGTEPRRPAGPARVF